MKHLRSVTDNVIRHPSLTQDFDLAHHELDTMPVVDLRNIAPDRLYLHTALGWATLTVWNNSRQTSRAVIAEVEDEEVAEEAILYPTANIMIFGSVGGRRFTPGVLKIGSALSYAEWEPRLLTPEDHELTEKQFENGVDAGVYFNLGSGYMARKIGAHTITPPILEAYRMDTDNLLAPLFE